MDPAIATVVVTCVVGLVALVWLLRSLYQDGFKARQPEVDLARYQRDEAVRVAAEALKRARARAEGASDDLQKDRDLRDALDRLDEQWVLQQFPKAGGEELPSPPVESGQAPGPGGPGAVEA